MPQATRYVQNHNNLLLSLGSISPQERDAINSINLNKHGRPRLILEVCSMHKGQWIEFSDLVEVNPTRFSGEYSKGKSRINKIFSTLVKQNLVEFNPENKDQFRITSLGTKFLYNKSILRPRKRNR